MENNIDLIAELNKVTDEAKINDPVTTEATPEVNQAKAEVKDSSEDFEPAKEIKPEQIIDKPEAEIPVRDKSYYQTSAKRWVKKINTGMKFLFKWPYKKALLEKNDEKIVFDFKREHETKSREQIQDVLSSNDEAYHAFERYNVYLDTIKKVELDEDEKEELSDALADWLEYYKKSELSPGLSLAITVLFIMLPRLEPMFTNFGKMFKRA
jgi:hypothetical protein